jgi:hypothetical protein
MMQKAASATIDFSADPAVAVSPIGRAAPVGSPALWAKPLREMRASFLVALGAALTVPWCGLIGYAVVKAVLAVSWPASQ